MVVVSPRRPSSSAVRQFWLFPPLSSNYSSSTLQCLSACSMVASDLDKKGVSAEHVLGYIGTFVALASEVNFRKHLSCAVAWWTTTWLPPGQIHALITEWGACAMYIKVRPMTGGDPATITVSKLTTIHELRVGQGSKTFLMTWMAKLQRVFL